jgi:hypothetical protein
MASIGSNHHPTSPSPVSMRGKLGEHQIITAHSHN